MPWQMGGPIHANAYYWLAKLRNWQIKYNPVEKRTPWSALDARHIEAKSVVQLAGYPDSCFLFRTPEVLHGEHLPLNDSRLEYCWFYLLEHLEINLAKRAETHADGSPISLVIPVENSIHGTTRSTYYPLHSLRVSLITALAIDGQMPIHILQKLVGHSRLIMTLYYTKPGASHIRQSLANATRRLEERRDASIVYFLRDASHERLVQQAIANSTKSLIATLPEHPGNRNPAGWQLLHHGLCLVGGNTSTIEGNKSIGGCHNGGPMATGKFGAHDPVPGGIRNCVRCRWFVKAHAQVVIDRRPTSAIAGSALAPTAASGMVSGLTEAERNALHQAITPEFLQSEGWHEGEHGQITNDRGRTVFRPGYVTAMRKVLGW
jgi:Putative phage integrase